MTLTPNRYAVIALSALFILGATLAGTLAAQEKTAPAKASAQNESAWIKRCDDLRDGDKITGQYCEIVQSLYVTQEGADPSSAQRLAEIAIGYPPNQKGKASAVAVLPLGIMLEEKAELLVDNSRVLSFKFRYCDNGGCAAFFDMSESDLNKLRKGKELSFKTQAATGQELMITLSLAGVSAMLDQIKPKS